MPNRDKRSFQARKRALALAAVVSLGAASLLAEQAGSAGPPTATTGAALSLTSSSANVTGTVNPNGQSTTYSFQFGTTTSYGFQTNPQSAGAGTQDQIVSATVTGLDSGTTYHYRLIATNASGTTVGADMTFTTLGTPPSPPPSPPPTATTGAAVDVGRTSATVRGKVNPKGASTTYHFEFGLTAAYGQQTASKTLAAGNRSRSVSAALRDLEPGQAYHYRLVASSANGVALGSDRTFTTLAPATTRALPSITSRARPHRDRQPPFRFRVRGRLILPAGVSPAEGCRGRVTVRLKLRGKTVGLRRARMTSACTYRARVRARIAPPRHSVRLRVKVRFRGNATLRPKSARTKIVRAG
jgi:phosphodiesterase/alkaline phosphatase D-like protein